MLENMVKLTNDGLKLKDTDAILQEVKGVFANAFPGLDIDSPDTPQGQIITFFTEKISEASNAIVELANQNFNGGFDSFEDINAQTFFGINRKPAAACVASLLVKGRPGVIIPRSFKVGDNANLEFVNVSGDTPIDDTGQATIQVECVKTGAYQALANTIKQILTPVFGIETVTNPEASTLGVEQETGLWARALDSRYNRAQALFDSILANVNNVPGVTDLSGFDNSYFQKVTHKGHEFPAHSFAIVAEGGKDQDIAEAIYRSRNPGPAMLGDTEVEILGNFTNQKYIIRFYRPQYVSLRAKLIVSLGKMADENYKETLTNQMVSIITKHKVNQTIFTDSIVLELKLPRDVFLVNAKLERLTIENIAKPIEGQDLIPLGFLEKAKIIPLNIEIERYTGDF